MEHSEAKLDHAKSDSAKPKRFTNNKFVWLIGYVILGLGLNYLVKFFYPAIPCTPATSGADCLPLLSTESLIVGALASSLPIPFAWKIFVDQLRIVRGNITPLTWLGLLFMFSCTMWLTWNWLSQVGALLNRLMN